MSLYQLQKLIYHVNRDPSQRERYRQIPPSSSKAMNSQRRKKAPPLTLMCENFTLSGFILYCFALHPVHKVSNEDYAKALAGLE